MQFLDMQAAGIMSDDHTLTPRAILDLYCEKYSLIYGRAPSVRYMGNHWFNIDGETVHRTNLLEEIERLHAMLKTITREMPAVTPPVQAAPPPPVPQMTHQPAQPMAEPALAVAGQPAARIDRGLIHRLINRLRGL